MSRVRFATCPRCRRVNERPHCDGGNCDWYRCEQCGHRATDTLYDIKGRFYTVARKDAA